MGLIFTYDGVNNTFNLGYRILQSKVTMALLSAHLEPYLGYLHDVRIGVPALALDVMECYRYLIDDFVIGFCRRLTPKDFELKTEMDGSRKGKRQFLNKPTNQAFLEQLDAFFSTKVSMRRIRRGKRQEVETLINEECLLLASFIRSEQERWVPRIPRLH